MTGGAGFIGSNFVHHLMANTDATVTVLDKLTYAGNRASLDGLARASDSRFVQGDICDADLVDELVGQPRRGGALRRRVAQRQLAARPVAVPADQPDRHLHAAGGGPPARHPLPPHLHRRGVRRPRARRPGNGSPSRPPTTRPARTPRPRPGPDLLVRAWVRSFGVQATISNCSNNYGPYQHVEKFIPRQITNVLDGGRPKLYGAGQNVRDWIHADDHSAAVLLIIERGPDRGDLPDRRRRGEEQHRRSSRPSSSCWAGPATTTTTSPTGPVTTCGTRSTPPSCAPSWAGGRGTPTSPPGLAQTIDWYRDHEAWWRPQKAGDRGARTPPRASNYGRAPRSAVTTPRFSLVRHVSGRRKACRPETLLTPERLRT